QVVPWWPVSTTRSTSVPYTVSGQTGGPATKNFNQQAGGGQWNLHGTYTFPAGAIGTVTVTGGANGRASADAVQFVLAGPADTTPPNTTITAGPTGTITVNSASFTWTGSDNVTPVGSLVYAFRLDPLEPSFSAFGSTTSKSYSGLANGSYTFYVKARDQAGNEDATPASST